MGPVTSDRTKNKATRGPVTLAQMKRISHHGPCYTSPMQEIGPPEALLHQFKQRDVKKSKLVSVGVGTHESDQNV